MPKRLVRRFAMTILMLGLSHAASLGGEEKADPGREAADEVLKRAVEKTFGCAPQTEKWDIKENGGRIKADSQKSKSGIAELLTLPFLFRDGRFSVSYEREAVAEGRTLDVIAFKALPEKEHVGLPKGSSYEARAANWAMNRMSGTVAIDRATDSIVWIRGRTPPERVKRFGGLWTAELRELVFSHEQKLVGESWLPARTTTLLDYSATFKGRERSLYEITYDCGISAQF